MEIDEFNFKQEVLNMKKPIILYCYKPNCSPCDKMKGIIDELEKELAGKVTIHRTDVSQDNEIVKKHKITAVPTFIFLKNGKEVTRKVGTQTKESLLAVVNT